MATKANEIYARMEGDLMRHIQAWREELKVLESGRVEELRAMIAEAETELAAHRERHKDKLPEPEPGETIPVPVQPVRGNENG